MLQAKEVQNKPRNDTNRLLSAVNVIAGQDFVETPFVSQLADRGLSYLRAGFPVHLLGPTGSGKTTLAFHISELLGRPVVLIYGDDDFGTSDLIGTDNGFQRRKTVDNYIHSVVKVEEDVTQSWVDNRLTFACREGYTLIYDEFTRSRPEANNALLSVLSEGVLVLPAKQGRRGYVKVHPDFHAIFTSNPAEYVGTHRTQDALLDRMITISIPGLDRATEIEIGVAHSGLELQTVARIVDLVNAVRDMHLVDCPPSARAVIMIAKIVKVVNLGNDLHTPKFEQICFDALGLRTQTQQDQFSSLYATWAKS